MRFTTWGVSGTMAVDNENYATLAEETLWRWIAAGDQTVNRFLPTSELSAINANPWDTHEVSDAFIEFFDAARESFDETEGLCTPTVLDALEAWGYNADIDEVKLAGRATPPTLSPAPALSAVTLNRDSRQLSPNGVRLDFGASAKAFVADQVAREVGRHTPVLVELGGDVAVGGAVRPWSVGVAEDAEHIGAPIGITSGGVATSSTLVRNWSTGTGRAHHIIDPRTGAPVISPWRTVSVAANSCLTANALSTASLLWGEEALYYVTQAGWAARFVDHDGKVLCVGGWPQEVAS
ncbi:MAG: FAD:protein FMN transferase [Actinomycetes bacterium]